jgi:hypothetical protein
MAEPARYTMTPVDEADTAAMYRVGSKATWGSTGVGIPISLIAVGSNLCAKSAP